MRFLIVILLSCLFLPSYGQLSQQEALKRAYTLLTSLKSGQGNEAASLLDSTVQEKITPSELNTLWRQIELGLQMGAFIDTQSYLYEEPVLFLGLVFEKGNVDFKVNFNARGEIDGFFLDAPIDKTPYSLPDYADTSKFTERTFKLQSGTYSLPGKLCIPKGAGPFPLVILSHGSGPNDMDEKMGPNRVFRDLAYGLASQGIAVYRFHKRTHVYGAASSSSPEKLTVQDEYIDDLLAAIDTLIKQERIDSKQVFLLGHSLGGIIAPRVALQSAQLKGIILAATSPTPMDSLALWQFEYLNALDSSGTYFRPLKEYKDELAYLRSEEFNLESDQAWLPFQLNAYYWKDILDYKVADTVLQYPGYVLILQAGDDYQVPPSEYLRWQAELKKRKRTYYASFNGLSHGFFESNGLKGPAQYEKQNNVSEAVIKRILIFVKKDAK